jgi:Rrf2 family protein
MPLSTKIHLAAAPLDPPSPRAEASYVVEQGKICGACSHVLAGLARSEDWARAAEAAEEATIPRKFLELILVQLRDRGLIESRRGVHGGYRLLRDPGNISVADIIRIVDGPLELTPFVSRTRFRPCTDCVDIRRCHLQPLMQQARDAVAGVLETCSLSALANRRVGVRPHVRASNSNAARCRTIRRGRHTSNVQRAGAKVAVQSVGQDNRDGPVERDFNVVCAPLGVRHWTCATGCRLPRRCASRTDGLASTHSAYRVLSTTMRGGDCSTNRRRIASASAACVRGLAMTVNSSPASASDSL